MKSSTIYEQFIVELERQGFSSETIPGYVKRIVDLVWYHQRLPSEISDGEVRQYVLHLVFEKKYAIPSVVSAISSIRAFFRYVLHRSDAEIKEMVPTLARGRKFPEVYSPDEVERLLQVPELRIEHRTMLMTLYAAGLRPDEVRKLKITDIQSRTMRIRVEARGAEDERYALLSPQLLGILRHYWRIFRPKVWLFPCPRDPSEPVSIFSVHRAFARAIRKSGLPDRGGVHLLRHSFAVHMLELGTSVPTLQRLLGHTWIVPTAIYIHLMRRGRLEAKNPLGLLPVDGTREEAI